MEDKVLEELRSLLDNDEIKTNEPLYKHTTYKIGGDADYFVIPNNVDKIRLCVEVAKKNNIPYFVLGKGSNIIASDDGYRGMIIYLGNNFADIVIEEEMITVEAGASIILVSNKAAQAGLSGLEFACGIPGTVGGAVTMNAGCYGSEISNVLVSAIILDEDGNIRKVTKDDLKMEYRHTIISDNSYILLSATFKLEKGNSNEIKEKMNEYNERRKKVQPLEYPNAGSVFKRPEGYYPGKLIEDAGFKGYQIGGAQVSTMHANFIINAGNAKASEIMKLINEIKLKVKEMVDVELELEQKILGEIN